MVTQLDRHMSTSRPFNHTRRVSQENAFQINRHEGAFFRHTRITISSRQPGAAS